MSVRHLDKMFKPQSVALIGASRRHRSIGQVVAKNLFDSGFNGPIMPVHPKETSIGGVLTYKSIADLPVVPDLGVIATPPESIPDIVDQLGQRGCRAAVVITAGFSEMGEEGRKLEEELLARAGAHDLRIMGPNCLGIMVPSIHFNASFCHVPPLEGDIACVAQSGAVLTSIVDWATAQGIGFSHLVSLGDKADVDFGDMLDYLAHDTKARAILLYIEAIKDARKFMSAARAAARVKPVIAIKAGRSDEAAKAASSHTGALAGSDHVYDAAFRRAGMLRVEGLNELFHAAETLAMGVKARGDRVAILSNGGGIGVLATDALIKAGGRMAELDPATIEKLNGVLPPTWSHGNPVDIIGDAPGKRYADSLEILLNDNNADAVLVLNCPTAIVDPEDGANGVIEVIKRHREEKANAEPVLTSWLGQFAAEAPRRLFAEARVPSYPTPDEAVNAFMHLVTYRKNQELLMESVPSVTEDFQPDAEVARRIIQVALDENREWLTEPEAKNVLKAYGVPIIETREVRNAEEAEQAARSIGKTVAIKILSKEITHKSDVGGVALNLRTPEEVRVAAEKMLETVRRNVPDASIDGLTVQEMADLSGATELIVGMTEDILFGPVLLFGQGGTAVEVVQDQALALPPLNQILAEDLIDRTRVSKLMKGYRDVEAVDRQAVVDALIATSRLVADMADIAELDINPLLATPRGVIALDARVKVTRAARPGTSRLAIKPYPAELERMVGTPHGSEYKVRPVRPQDERLLQDMIARTDPEDVRLRFFSPLRSLPRQMAARLTQIDYNREMALVAFAKGSDEMGGIVRIAADPDNESAEYAVLVRSDLKGTGLGWLLMNAILDYARSQGIKRIDGQVLRENTVMLSMCDKLGFTRHGSDEDGGLIEVSKILTEEAAQQVEVRPPQVEPAE